MKENNVVTSETKDALSFGSLSHTAASSHILVIEHLADGLLFHKHIESLLDGKQQLLDVLVGFHGFLALVLLWLL